VFVLRSKIEMIGEEERVGKVQLMDHAATVLSTGHEAFGTTLNRERQRKMDAKPVWDGTIAALSWNGSLR